MRFSNGDSAKRILLHLDRTTKLNDEGEVALPQVQQFKVSLLVLAACIDFSPDISEFDRIAITREAFVAAKKAGDVVSKFLPFVVTRHRAYLQAGISRFVLLTSLSVDFAALPKPARVNSSQITFCRLRPKKMSLPSTGVITRALEEPLPHRYTAVTVSVLARSPHSAAQVALERLDLFRASWGLYDSQRHWKWPLNHGRPNNEVVLGPLHTIHFHDGRTATDDYWTTHFGAGSPKPTRVSEGEFGRFLTFRANLTRRLQRHQHKDLILGFLLRYVRCLDEDDATSTLLKLWSLIEALTLTGQGSTFGPTIDRAAFLSPDPDWTRMVLLYIKDARNNYVHSAVESDDANELVFHLKTVTDRLLRFWIVDSPRFRGKEEVGRFLQLSTDNRMVNRSLYLLSTAKELRAALTPSRTKPKR